MKSVKVFKNPRAFKILADETRRKIIYLLRVKERTVSQIAEELEKTPQAIYHHIRKLLDADMVEVAKEVRIDHFIETYYQATAEVFECVCAEECRSIDTSAEELHQQLGLPSPSKKKKPKASTSSSGPS